MANKTVVRNQAYSRGSISIRERHNERKNECYSNADIQLERSAFNIHFRQCEGTYRETFDKLVADGVITTRGLKPDAKIIDEMVFDINTVYFEENGGYSFAKRFYEDAYKLAVKEAGDERYILSAVMHADEVNKAVSAELKKDVYHYHLHVIYIPVVNKEVKWTKRCKNPELVGKVKEIIHQVSHSKKWPRSKNEKGEWINSYSLLQDRFYEHMTAAGFKDFERGEYKSTRQHLSDVEYKIQKDRDRLEWLEQAIEKKECKYMDMDMKIESKKEQIATLDKRLDSRMSGEADLKCFEDIGKKNLIGQIILTPKELKAIKNLAQVGVIARGKIYDLENMLKSAKRETEYALRQRDTWKSRHDELMDKTKLFREVVSLIPQKATEVLTVALEEHKTAQQTRQQTRWQHVISKSPHRERSYER